MVAYLKGLDKNGNCCNDCNGIDKCECSEADWVVICEYCNSLNYSAGASVTEYKLFSASETCYGNFDYTVAGIYSEVGSNYSFFRFKEETQYTRTFSSPAYIQQYQWHSGTKQTRTTFKLDEDGNNIPCGGYSAVYYTNDGTLEAISPYPSFEYVEEYQAYLPTSCSRRGARWYGLNSQYSWVDGHPSEGGWVNSVGTAIFLSSSRSPTETNC